MSKVYGFVEPGYPIQGILTSRELPEPKVEPDQILIKVGAKHAPLLLVCL